LISTEINQVKGIKGQGSKINKASSKVETKFRYQTQKSSMTGNNFLFEVENKNIVVYRIRHRREAYR
jgi:hypothetical protein